MSLAGDKSVSKEGEQEAFNMLRGVNRCNVRTLDYAEGIKTLFNLQKTWNNLRFLRKSPIFTAKSSSPGS